MRYERRFKNYQEALRFKNKLMFAKIAKNPRLKKHNLGWSVSYEAKKFIT